MVTIIFRVVKILNGIMGESEICLSHSKLIPSYRLVAICVNQFADKVSSVDKDKTAARTRGEGSGPTVYSYAISLNRENTWVRNSPWCCGQRW